ncbi:uncharacterized protein LOC132299517 [Cornus florida]|uniref:uncharacterized protein LOC132299517 n=1 Tax=Cornus florida TaxID=4283 RepID=UPI00289800D8|nr:uncharacterized protein LOC132299517 [Cornus florida]
MISDNLKVSSSERRELMGMGGVGEKKIGICWSTHWIATHQEDERHEIACEGDLWRLGKEKEKARFIVYKKLDNSEEDIYLQETINLVSLTRDLKCPHLLNAKDLSLDTTRTKIVVVQTIPWWPRTIL